MARTGPRPQPTRVEHLHTTLTDCPECGRPLRPVYCNRRSVSTLTDVVRLILHIRRCHHSDCSRWLKPYRPEQEARYALPQHEFGLDVIALVGSLRHAEHRSIPEIHQQLVARGLVVCERTVTNLLERYDELLAVTLTDNRRLQRLLAGQGRILLAIDGLQPDVGHEVLWVLRDCLSGEVLLARSLLSGRQQDLVTLLQEVKDGLTIPIQGVVSDGQHSIRKAVAEALPGVPHQLCHFHYLREAAKPIYEADRNAKKELKKHVRGVRPIERKLEDRTDPEAEVIRGYCDAIRSAVTDDGRPPLEAPGLKLQERLSDIAASLERVAEKRELPRELQRVKKLVDKGLKATATLWPALVLVYGWVWKAAHILGDKGASNAQQARRQLGGLLGALTCRAESAGRLAGAVRKFIKVTRSYWAGLFHYYDVADLPRTNNDLEQYFGRHRYHERRCSGRKCASPGLVLRGEARLLAAAATRQRRYSAEELSQADEGQRQQLQERLESRRLRRVNRYRFRRDPKAYLLNLEEKLLQSTLLS
jgi:hypothetical protein